MWQKLEQMLGKTVMRRHILGLHQKQQKDKHIYKQLLLGYMASVLEK